MSSANFSFFGSPWDPLDTWVNGLAISPDSKIVALACVNRTILLRDVTTSMTLGGPLTGHTNSVRCVAFTPNGNRLLSGSDEGHIRVWDLNQMGDSVGQWDAHKGAVRSIAISPCGKYAVSGGDDAKVRLWDLVEGKPLGDPLQRHTKPVSCVKFSQTGNFIAACDDGGSLATYKYEPVLSFVNHVVGKVNWFSPIPGKDEILTGCEDMTVRKLNLSNLVDPKAAWREHTGAIRSVSVFPNAKTALSGGDDCTLCMWDLETGVKLGELWRGPEMPIQLLEVAPNGKYVVTAGASEVWSWEINYETVEA